MSIPSLAELRDQMAQAQAVLADSRRRGYCGRAVPMVTLDEAALTALLRVAEAAVEEEIADDAISATEPYTPARYQAEVAKQDATQRKRSALTEPGWLLPPATTTTTKDADE